MSVTSGKDGTATWATSEISELMNWAFDDQADAHPYHTNDSGGTELNVVGIHRSSGTFRVQTLPTATAGAGADLVMYDNTNIYTVTIVVTNLASACDMGGAIIGWDVTWVGNSAMVPTTGSYSA
jgi:hypothetical protein